MKTLYNIIVQLYALAIRTAAFQNAKAKQWIEGRKNIWQHLSKITTAIRPLWFHVSSSGEFEQARPVIELFKKHFPEIPVVLTFFSPSGYERFKHFDGVDFVAYLPLDTRSNAYRFLQSVRPRLAFFVKYEFWYHYFEQLHIARVPFFLISAVFHPGQPFFKFYGRSYRSVLSFPDYFFLQDEASALWLQRLGHTNGAVVGDTRIDRVAEIAQTPYDAPWLAAFKGDGYLLIAGSTWQKEEEMLLSSLDKARSLQLRMVIAPHEIDEDSISTLAAATSGLRYTHISADTDFTKYQVIILDTIGLLSRLYRYADMALIGGGFNDGIHSILEPAAHGVPVLFGPRHQKFWEAAALFNEGAAAVFNSPEEGWTVLSNWCTDVRQRTASAEAAAGFIQRHSGASKRVFSYLTTHYRHELE